MNVLALDPSSKAIGYAVHDVHTGISSGAWAPLNWRARAFSRDQRHRHMCGRSGEWLSDMITMHGPSVIVIEVGGGYQTDACSERLRGALFLVTWTREIATVTVQPSVWQAWAKRSLTQCLTQWQTDDKPDDDAAEMILRWFLATHAHRVEAA